MITPVYGELALDFDATRLNPRNDMKCLVLYALSKNSIREQKSN